MYVWYQMFFIVTIIYYTCTIVSGNSVRKSDSCDCDVLEIDDPDPDLIGYQNFTKQNQTINGKPIYFSIQQNVISWYYEVWHYEEYDANIEFFRPRFKYDPPFFSFENPAKNGCKNATGTVSPHKVKSRCLRDNSNCSGTRELTHNLTYGFKVSKQVQLQAKAPCQFPFIYKNEKYESCTKMDRENVWCATTVNATNHMTSWGFCTDSCPIKENEMLKNDKEDVQSSTTIITISICAVLFVLSIVTFYWYIKRNKNGKEKDTIMKGNIAMINEQLALNEQAAHLSYSGDHEIDRSKFEIGRKLGGGNFGSVHVGMVEDLIHPGQMHKVAIKSVNNPLDPSQIYSLICEIKILDQLEKRLDLVNMVGACTTQFKSGKIWLLLEYCPHGDMKTFLLKNRDAISQGLYDKMVPHEILNTRLFIKWSHSICTGMEYLSSKKIMHGDLAARNILITKLDNDESYMAKITDFGLSKAFYEDASYLKQERTSIPWKWMAVEYFETNVLTLSSDVWSFGVVFWEILSFGQFPYAGGDCEETIKKIKSGFRLPVPDEVKETIWLSKCYNDVTEMCWQLDPKKRCSFSDLVKTFETHLTSEEKEDYKKLEQSIIKNQANKERSYNSMQDNSEAVNSNLMAKVIELNYVDSV